MRELEGGGRECGGRDFTAATRPVRPGMAESRRGAGRRGESSEAAGAASGPPRGWCSPAAAAASSLRPELGEAGFGLASGALCCWAGPSVAREIGRWAGHPAQLA